MDNLRNKEYTFIYIFELIKQNPRHLIQNLNQLSLYFSF